METEELRAFFKHAKKGDQITMADANGNPVVYVMSPGNYMNVAGQEEDPFIQAYLNSIDTMAGGRKLYPQKMGR